MQVRLLKDELYIKTGDYQVMDELRGRIMGLDWMDGGEYGWRGEGVITFSFGRLSSEEGIKQELEGTGGDYWRYLGEDWGEGNWWDIKGMKGVC